MHEQLAAFTAAGGGGVHRPGAGEDEPVPHRETPPARRQRLSVDREVDRGGEPLLLYCLDADFGPFFLKFCSYFPYTAKLCLNGHHWAQRQAGQAGIGFTAMDNAFASVEDLGRAAADL